MVFLLLLLPAICGGCAEQHKHSPDYIARPEPPPSAVQVSKLYNPSLEHLDRLWARTELRIQGQDKDGKEFDESAEGHLQFIRPGMVSLTVKKLGDTYFALGSSADRYWWMDLRKPRSALLGTLAKASPRIVERFGVPVHPLDLIDLLGVLPINPAGASTAWSPDGRQVVMTSKGRWGDKRLCFSPEGDRLLAVQLLNDQGLLVCESTITQTDPVEFRENPERSASVPTRLSLRIPSRDTTVTVYLHDPQNRGKSMQEAPFNPDLLLKAYNIAPADVRSLDSLKPSPATSSAPAPPGTTP